MTLLCEISDQSIAAIGGEREREHQKKTLTFSKNLRDDDDDNDQELILRINSLTLVSIQSSSRVTSSQLFSMP